MRNPGADPRYVQYNNDQLAELIAREDTNPTEKKRMREELTRRLRDDLIHSAQKVPARKSKERRRQSWRKGRLVGVLLLILLCVLAFLCVWAFLPNGLFNNLRSLFVVGLALV